MAYGICEQRPIPAKPKRTKAPDGWGDPGRWHEVRARAFYQRCEHCEAEYPVELRLVDDPYSAYHHGSGPKGRRYCSLRCLRAAKHRRYRWGSDTPPERQRYDSLKLRAKRVRDQLAGDDDT